MTDDGFDFEQHERLRTRVANSMDSLLWTYKQHYKAADIYARLDMAANAVSAILAGVLTYSLIWKTVPKMWMVGMAISIAVISGFTTAARPQKRSEAHFDIGGEYHDLFDRFRDYTQLKLANRDYGLECMRGDYEELAGERRRLNKNRGDLSSVWYYWVKFSNWRSDSSIYGEVETGSEAKYRLTGEARLVGEDPDADSVGSEAKDRLTGDAELDRGEEG
jgi:hypothetical protein